MFIHRSTFMSNSVSISDGGAIVANGGRLDIWDSQFLYNSADDGGAIYTDNNNILTIHNSVVNHNQADLAGGGGGGLYLHSNSEIINSIIAHNEATGGGGLLFGIAPFKVINSTIYDNFVTGSGGGIYSTTSLGDNFIENSTISGNHANHFGGGIVAGSTNPHLFIINSTIVYNIADYDADGYGEGGGLFASPNTPVKNYIQNSIVALNEDWNPNISHPDCRGRFDSLGYNLIGNSDNCLYTAAVGDLVGTGSNPIDPLLRPLHLEGDTPVHVPLPYSPAINNGNPTTPGSSPEACLSQDQRGVSRPQGAACDMGAVELIFELQLSKSAPARAVIYQPITYSLAITNNTQLTLTNLVLTDVIPSGASYISGGTRVGSTVSWTFPSLVSGQSAAASFVVTATATITNDVYHVTSDEGIHASGSTPIVTQVDIPLTALQAHNNSPTVLGQPTLLTTTLAAGTQAQYSWAWGDGQVGSGAVVSHTYPAVGVYTAVVTAHNRLNQLTATTLVTIEEKIVGLTALNDSPTIWGEATTLEAEIVAGSGVHFSWDFGDGVTGTGQIVSHTYPAPGSYTAVVTAQNGVTRRTDWTAVWIAEPVQADFTASNRYGVAPLTTQFNNASTGDYSHSLWSFGDGYTSTLAHPSHTYEAVGVYTVTLTVSGDGGSQTVTKVGYVVVVDVVRLFLPMVANVASE